MREVSASLPKPYDRHVEVLSSLSGRVERCLKERGLPRGLVVLQLLPNGPRRFGLLRAERLAAQHIAELGVPEDRIPGILDSVARYDLRSRAAVLTIETLADGTRLWSLLFTEVNPDDSENLAAEEVRERSTHAGHLTARWTGQA